MHLIRPILRTCPNLIRPLQDLLMNVCLWIKLSNTWLKYVDSNMLSVAWMECAFERSSVAIWPCDHLRSPTHLCCLMAPTYFLSYNTSTFSPPAPDSVKHFITCAVFQKPWPALKYKVFHILDAKSLVSTTARGDPEDKCSFPEWFIMLRLHYLAFGGWQKSKE